MKPYDASRFNHDCCRPFLHEGGEKGVLLLHGFTGSVAHMRPLGDALATGATP
jgi:esterase/lipase